MLFAKAKESVEKLQAEKDTTAQKVAAKSAAVAPLQKAYEAAKASLNAYQNAQNALKKAKENVSAAKSAVEAAKKDVAAKKQAVKEKDKAYTDACGVLAIAKNITLADAMKTPITEEGLHLSERLRNQDQFCKSRLRDSKS